MPEPESLVSRLRERAEKKWESKRLHIHGSPAGNRLHREAFDLDAAAQHIEEQRRALEVALVALRDGPRDEGERDANIRIQAKWFVENALDTQGEDHA